MDEPIAPQFLLCNEERGTTLLGTEGVKYGHHSPSGTTTAPTRSKWIPKPWLDSAGVPFPRPLSSLQVRDGRLPVNPMRIVTL